MNKRIERTSTPIGCQTLTARNSVKVLNESCDARPIENKLIFVMGVQFECVCCPRIELNNYDARPIVLGVTSESV